MCDRVAHINCQSLTRFDASHFSSIGRGKMWKAGVYDPHSREDLAKKGLSAYQISKMEYVNLHTRRARTSNRDFTTRTDTLRLRAEAEWEEKYRGASEKKRRVKSAAALAEYMKPDPSGSGMLLVCLVLHLNVSVL